MESDSKFPAQICVNMKFPFFVTFARNEMVILK